jgi:hypothetical protein
VSRSVKHPPMSRRPRSPDLGDPPGTQKAGSRSRPNLRGRSARQGWLLSDRRTFWFTEKILRLFSKAGRRVDRAAIRESGEAS